MKWKFERAVRMLRTCARESNEVPVVDKLDVRNKNGVETAASVATTKERFKIKKARK